MFSLQSRRTLCYPQNYSQHNSPTTTNSDQNNSSITLSANEQTATYLVKSHTTIVLQTSSACVTNPKHVHGSQRQPEDQFCVVNVLFDTGSQQTFISDRLVKELKLAPLRNTEESNLKLSEYEIVVKSICNDQRRVIKANMQ